MFLNFLETLHKRIKTSGFLSSSLKEQKEGSQGAVSPSQLITPRRSCVQSAPSEKIMLCFPAPTSSHSCPISPLPFPSPAQQLAHFHFQLPSWLHMLTFYNAQSCQTQPATGNPVSAGTAYFSVHTRVCVCVCVCARAPTDAIINSSNGPTPMTPSTSNDCSHL